MIKKIFLLLVLALFVSTYGSNNWRQVTKATHSSLSDVFFINESIGWVAGADGTILRTTDGGYTWEEPTDSLPVIESMFSIYFVNENVGYAGGANDLLLKSTDGGLTWNEITFESVGGKIYSIYFADELKGWVLSGVSKGGEISYTNDGGETWSVQVTETFTNLRAMSFSSSGHGICVGSKSGKFAFYYTKDGQSWIKAPSPTGIPHVYTRTDIYTVAMADNNVASASGWGSVAAGLQPTITLRTADGGATWEYQTQEEENRIYVNIHGMTFKDALTGIAVGGSSYKGGVAYKTTDGGINWAEITLPTGFQGRAISMINDRICIVGSNGGIVISEDAGTTWQLITEIPSSTLFVIDKIGERTIVAAGFYGVFLKSTDYGKTWIGSYVADKNVCPTIEDLFFLDENIGFAAQRNRTVSKTIDGGTSWKQIMQDTLSTKVNNYGVQFITENIGYVVGKSGSNVSAFYKTVNGGITWSSLIADPNLTNELNALHFFDENNGVVAGDETTLAYTTDGGTTWNKVTPQLIPSGNHDFNKIDFLNDSFGLAAGEKLIKTNDAGKTWQYVEVTNLPGKIEGIAIVDELTWYLTGRKYLLHTTDGGTTWNDILDLDIVTSHSNYDVMVDPDGYIWLSSSKSEIFSTSSAVGVKRLADNLLNNFSLEANYPNPFNPSTIIRYSIPSHKNFYSEPQNVLLKVYNLLGQEVTTLVNEAKKSGTYEALFNASELTSGVYIYTLKSGGFSESRKMLLIK